MLHTYTGTGQTMEWIHDIISITYNISILYLYYIYNIVCGMCNVWGVCCCYVAPAPPMTPRCPAEPAAAAHSCGQLRGKSAAAPRTAPALTSPLHNRDVPWPQPQPPHGQIWSRHRHRPRAADPRSGSEIFLWAFVNTTAEINYPLSPGRFGARDVNLEFYSF